MRCLALKWALTLIFLLVIVSLSFAGEDDIRTAVLLSESIRPYVEAAQGFSEFMPGEVIELTIQRSKRVVPDDLLESKWDLILAVGPHALSLLPIIPGDTPRLYTMVLNPQDAIPKDAGIPGVSLNIPARFQAKVIRNALPDVRRVGVFYDPKFSSTVIDEFQKAGREHDLVLVPMQVLSQKDIRDALNERLESVDALLMIPDPTVVSESIVAFLIKEALKKGVPVIGYNRFFAEKGALLSFIIDYKGVGRRTARLAKEILSGKESKPLPPPVTVEVNRKLADKFGFHLGRIIESDEE
ncbi:MAG: hypothetical protein HY788_18365 [Deltaproteobacteria bacterium]|nr:hypothetical protein [Deltaproteobacteria bacterium]